MIDDSPLPVPIVTGAGRVSTLDRLAEIPEEEIWLQKQKSPRARPAYRQDVGHFMRTLAITTPEELPHIRPVGRAGCGAFHADAGDHDAGGIAPGRPQGGDHLGALHARERA